MSTQLKTFSESNPLISSSGPMFESEDFMGHLPIKSEAAVKVSPGLFDSFDSPFDADVDLATPFSISSSALDSVFSSVLDDHTGMQDHTPMFDDLELGPELEWGLLFGPEFTSVKKESPLVEFGTEEILSEQQETASVPDSPFQEQPIPIVRKRSYTESLSEPLQEASPLPTPLLDAPKKVKLDKFGCVAYSKKNRSRPLDPIEPVHDDDPIAMKRAKNTEAARRSRARKMERMGQLEEKIEGLVEEKGGLEAEVTRLRKILESHGLKY